MPSVRPPFGAWLTSPPIPENDPLTSLYLNPCRSTQGLTRHTCSLLFHALCFCPPDFLFPCSVPEMCPPPPPPKTTFASCWFFLTFCLIRPFKICPEFCAAAFTPPSNLIGPTVHRRYTPWLYRRHSPTANAPRPQNLHSKNPTLSPPSFGLRFFDPLRERQPRCAPLLFRFPFLVQQMLDSNGFPCFSLVLIRAGFVSAQNMRPISPPPNSAKPFFKLGIFLVLNT